MRPLRQFSRWVLLMCMAAAGLSAQEERALLATEVAGIGTARPALSNDGEVLFRASVEEVEVRFVATDPTGHPVKNLRSHDVKVIADGKFSPDIKSFGPVRDFPITLGIVVDLSESIRPEMHSEVVATSTALTELLQPARDREFVVAFSNKVNLLQAPTSDFARVKHILENSSGDHNLTSLYDAIVRTCRDEFDYAGPKERRILLLFTDGVDNLSIHSMTDAVDAAREAGVAIYAIAPEFGDPEGRKILRTLAERTGGTLELIRTSKQPDMTIASLQQVLGSEYALTFRPPDDGPGAHPVELHATTTNAIVFRTEKSYYVTETR